MTQLEFNIAEDAKGFNTVIQLFFFNEKSMEKEILSHAEGALNFLSFKGLLQSGQEIKGDDVKAAMEMIDAMPGMLEENLHFNRYSILRFSIEIYKDFYTVGFLHNSEMPVRINCCDIEALTLRIFSKNIKRYFLVRARAILEMDKVDLAMRKKRVREREKYINTLEGNTDLWKRFSNWIRNILKT